MCPWASIIPLWYVFERPGPVWFRPLETFRRLLKEYSGSRSSLPDPALEYEVAG